MPNELSFLLLISLLSLLTFLILEWLTSLRCSKTLYETVVDNEVVFEKIKGFSVEGYSLTIFCQRKCYRRKYKKWYIPDKVYFIYYLSGTASPDAPAKLKTVLIDNVSIPTIAHHRKCNKWMEREVLMSYLDVIISRLEKTF